MLYNCTLRAARREMSSAGKQSKRALKKKQHDYAVAAIRAKQGGMSGPRPIVALPKLTPAAVVLPFVFGQQWPPGTLAPKDIMPMVAAILGPPATAAVGQVTTDFTACPAAALQCLRAVSFSGAGYECSDGALARYAEACPRLERVSTFSTGKGNGVTNTGVCGLASRCAYLSFVDLTGASISGAALTALGTGCTRLRTLVLTEVTPARTGLVMRDAIASGDVIAFVERAASLDSLHLPPLDERPPVDPLPFVRSLLRAFAGRSVRCLASLPLPAGSAERGAILDLLRDGAGSLAALEWRPREEVSPEEVLHLQRSFPSLRRLITWCGPRGGDAVAPLVDAGVAIRHASHHALSWAEMTAFLSRPSIVPID